MNITEVRVVLKDEEKLKGFASITIDDCLVVKNLRIIAGSNGYFVSMPSKQKHDGSYQDIVHPINNDTRLLIENKVLDAYEQRLKEQQAIPPKEVANG